MIFDEPLITSTLVLGLIVFACAFGGALLACCSAPSCPSIICVRSRRTS